MDFHKYIPKSIDLERDIVGRAKAFLKIITYWRGVSRDQEHGIYTTGQNIGKRK